MASLDWIAAIAIPPWKFLPRGYASHGNLHGLPFANLTSAAILEPVRVSYRDSKPIEWTRVNALPDFVYFNHSIHINKGSGPHQLPRARR